MEAATYILANGNITEILPEKDCFSDLELSRLVDGPIRVVATNNYSGQVVVMNQEGVIKLLPINKKASLMFPSIATRGNVVVCHRSMLSKELKQLLKK